MEQLDLKQNFQIKQQEFGEQLKNMQMNVLIFMQLGVVMERKMDLKYVIQTINQKLVGDQVVVLQHVNQTML
jgi:hypothetical protein